MTVKCLHKLLGKLIGQGHGRKPIYVNKETFHHPLEADGVVTCEPCGLTIVRLRTIDGDGFTQWRKDGRESSSAVVLLWGTLAIPQTGMLPEPVTHTDPLAPTELTPQ